MTDIVFSNENFVELNDDEAMKINGGGFLWSKLAILVGGSYALGKVAGETLYNILH